MSDHDETAGTANGGGEAPARPPVRGGAAASGKRGVQPPRRERSTWLAWLSVVLCLSATSSVVLNRIGSGGSWSEQEAASIERLSATLAHQRAMDEAWSAAAWTPVEGEALAYDQPPGVAWVQLLAARDLEAGAVDRGALRLRSRLASGVMLLLAVAGTFWAAHAIGGMLPATLAGLAAGSMPLWVMWGRSGEGVIVAAGWALLAIGAGMWATRPLRPPPSVPRQVLGWALCGAFLAVAVLCGGLRVLPPAVTPMVIVLAVAPHRVGHLLGLLAAVVVMGLALTPWALYVHEHDPEAWRTWWGALNPTQWERPMDYGRLVGLRVGALAVLLLPWTGWVAAGLMQTFSTSTGGARLRMLIGWAWFVAVGAMMVASPGQRVFAPLALAAPAGAIVIGQLFRQFSDLASGGRFPRLWRWLRWPHVGLLAALTLGLTGAAAFQRDLVGWGWLERPWVAPMAWQYWAGTAVIGLGLLAWSGKTVFKHEPARSGVLWGVWGIVMSALLAGPIAQGPLPHDRGITPADPAPPAATLVRVEPEPTPAPR